MASKNVKYSSDLKDSAIKNGKRLFTVDTPGMTVQGTCDDSLEKDLINAVIKFAEREKAKEQAKA